jgi:hypothetical protein
MGRSFASRGSGFRFLARFAPVIPDFLSNELWNRKEWKEAGHLTANYAQVHPAIRSTPRQPARLPIGPREARPDHTLR